MDFPTPLTNPPRQKTTTAYQTDIDVALLHLRVVRGATIHITPFEKPHFKPGHIRTLGDPIDRADLTITMTTADGHTITHHADATYPNVLWVLQRLVRGEELIVCGTPRPVRVGQKFRARNHTCGTAYPHRRMPYPGTSEVWRCQDCDAKHTAHKDATARRRNRKKARA